MTRTIIIIIILPYTQFWFRSEDTHIVGTLDDTNEGVGEGANGPVKLLTEGILFLFWWVESLNFCPNSVQLIYNAFVRVSESATSWESTVILECKNWDNPLFL